MTRSTIGSVVRAALVLAAAGVPAAAQEGRPRERQRSDSLVILRVELDRADRTQRWLVGQYQRAQEALLRAGTETARDEARERVNMLSVRLGKAIEHGDVLRMHLETACAQKGGPDGWLGINFNTELELFPPTQSPTAFKFRKYLLIEAVEPGSPAQKAGLAAGDEIVKLGEHDVVSGTMDLADLLRPGLRLPVGYRRDGTVRMVTVLVEKRPQGFVSACPWVQVALSPPALARQPHVRIIQTPKGYSYVFNTAPDIPAAPDARAKVSARASLPPTPYAPLRIQRALSTSSEFVAGAVLMPLTDQLREGLGLEAGILVTEVVRGSPALAAGLRAGDVIVAANGRKVSTIPALVSILDEASDSGVEFQVVLRGATRLVRLRP
ncbi:MAG: PDZ domain-containing protein [Gemmatimonadaceae bacterium]